MKKLLFFLGILTIFCFAKCKKDKTDFNGLPAATQSGKNTLGFLLNGQPWMPSGFDGGMKNLSLNIDSGYNNGILSLGAYRYTGNNSDNKQIFGFGLRDSVNFMSVPENFIVSKNSLLAFFYNDRSGCIYDTYADTSVYRMGNLTIQKFDKTQKIISGTFNATLYKAGCDTIKITDGRFDMKY